ncbi:MAG: hypothetical protein EOP51_04065 [Sphingobacteriales bacterium]|nr:MAG: hypothetical protein EOP51_04065 [Sphingobacteriales bacterium]
MASLTITINTPALTSGQYIKERHRQLPAGAWSSVTNRTNATFTLAGITPGDYQFEFILVKADGTNCQAKYYTYTVTEAQEFECITFTVTQQSNPDKLKIAYTLPVGYVAPACGYTVGYRIGHTGAYIETRYTALPASPFYIPLPFGGQDLDVRITADQCDAAKICFDETVPKPPVVPCSPMGNFKFTITPLEGNNQFGNRTFKCTLTGTQSSTPTTAITLHLTQVYVVAPATAWSTVLTLSGLPTSSFSISFNLTFNHNIGLVNTYYWDASFVDACGFNQLIHLNYP